MLQVLLTIELRRDPLRTYHQFAQDMQPYGFKVDKDFVRRTFQRFNVSVKDAQYKHILKFTAANMRYYARWLVFSKSAVNWDAIKFADETSCESKGAQHFGCAVLH